jgi:hypothetical protein
MMDKVQKHNSFNTNTPSSESYRNHLYALSTSICTVDAVSITGCHIIVKINTGCCQKFMLMHKKYTCCDNEVPRIILLHDLKGSHAT